MLPYEIGNALIAGKKRKRHRLTDKDIHLAFARSQRIPVRLVQIRIDEALKLVLRWNIYAYGAYNLQCARENELPLLSWDVNFLGVRSILLDFFLNNAGRVRASNQVFLEILQGDSAAKRAIGSFFLIFPYEAPIDRPMYKCYN